MNIFFFHSNSANFQFNKQNKNFFNHYADNEGELQPDKFFELVMNLQPAAANLNPNNLKEFLIYHFNMNFEAEKGQTSKENQLISAFQKSSDRGKQSKK